jgi:chloramphenicol-sensitive protein RarD
VPKNITRGLSLGFTAYFIWGSFPVIISLLSFATPWEIVVWRIIFGLAAGLVFIAIARSGRQFLNAFKSKRIMLWILLSSISVMINWTVYVYAVANHHVVESSLGYFINPLITILIAVVALREKLRPLQWVAVGFGAVAVGILTFDYGRLPWIALALASSFGIYGLAKNKMGDLVTPLHSYTIETVLLTPVALLMLLSVGINGPITFVTQGWLAATGLAIYGVMTAVPLILFGVAAKNLPLSWIGLMQYLTPILQFSLGVLYFKEDMPLARWYGFGLVWCALVILSVDMLRRVRKNSVVNAA